MTSTYVRVMSRLGKHAGLRVFRIFGRRLRERAATAAQGVVCRLLKEREVLALCVDPALDLVPLKVQAAYARGDVCVGGFQHGVFAGYCWFALSPLPQLDGAWFRAFDFKRWEHWGANADAGWGVWCVETGWTQGWITTALAMVCWNSEI